MFISHNKVRMHDTDMAGILYFAKQFRFVHDALEDLVEAEGFNFDTLFHKFSYVFVIVHAEGDYLKSVQVGDALTVHVEILEIGNSSFTIGYKIYRHHNELIGKAKTVHVTLDSKTRTKIAIPESLKEMLKKYLAK